MPRSRGGEQAVQMRAVGDGQQLGLLPVRRLVGTPSMVEVAQVDFPTMNIRDEFLQSINDNGVLQPVAVIRNPASGFTHLFKVAAGRRRLTACRQLGIEVIPALIFPEGTPPHLAVAISLIENTHRAPNPVDEYRAIRTLINEGASEQDIVEQLGLPRAVVRRRMRLGQLSTGLMTALEEGRVAPTTAERIASSLDVVQQRPLSQMATSGQSIRMSDYNRVRSEIEALNQRSQGSVPGTEPTREALGAVTGNGVDFLGRQFVTLDGVRWIREQDVPLNMEGRQVSLDELEGMETWPAVRLVLEVAQRTLPVEMSDTVDDVMDKINEALQIIETATGNPQAVAPAPAARTRARRAVR